MVSRAEKELENEQMAHWWAKKEAEYEAGAIVAWDGDGGSSGSGAWVAGRLRASRACGVARCGEALPGAGPCRGLPRAPENTAKSRIYHIIL